MIRAAIIFLLLSCGTKHPDRDYRTFNVLADGTTLITFWDRPDGPGLGRIDTHGTLLWSVALQSSPQRAFDRAALLIADDVVAVRTYRHTSNRDRIQLEAFSIRDGKHLWTTTLRERESFSDAEAEGLDPNYWGHSTRDRFVLYLSAGAKDPATTYEIDARTGREVRRAALKLASGSFPATAFGESAIIHDLLTNRDIVSSVSETRAVEGYGVGCVVDDDYWRLVRIENHWSLSSLVEPARQVALPEQPAYLNLGGCARYRDSWLLVADTGHRSELWILDANGRMQAREQLGVRLAAPMAGRATRFVPLLVDYLGRYELVMMDFEEHAVAWRLAAGLLDETFRVGDRWYWITSDGRRLVQFDGADGRIAHAIRVDAPWVAPLRASHVAGEVMKVLRGMKDGVRSITIDMQTLKPIEGQLDVKDARDDADRAVLPRKMR